MVEYVYAQRDFVAEYEGEIALRPGERIEVIEKDERYDDGWWQGRNLAGEVGLFPKSHIQPARPRTQAPRAVVPATAPLSLVLADKAQPSTVPIPSNKQPRLQPVQEGTDTVAAPNQATASGMDELMRTAMTSARQKFAEKAKAVEKQAASDVADGRVTLRSTAPPIEVELSDDSGDEVVDMTAPHRQVYQKFAYTPSIQPFERYIVPSMVPLPESGLIENNASETTVATPTQPLFSQNETVRTSENNNSLLSPLLPGLRGISNRVSANHPSSAPLVFPSETQTLGLQEVVEILSIPSHFPSGRHGHGRASRSSVATSAFITNSSLFSAPTSPQSADSVSKKSRDVDPVEPNVAVEWNVEEVVDWLRAKGFDDMVCDKFIEQEVRGDFLLDLDVGVLKSEIGIVGFGTRMRIVTAISELRRPSSVLSYDSESPTRPGSPPFRGSPLALSSATSLSTIFGIPASPQSSSDLGELAEQPSEPPYRGSDPGASKAADSDMTVGLGLGIPASLLARSGEGKPVKGRPPQLPLSPSDPAMAANAKGVSVEQRLMDEDRRVLGDSDTKNVVTKGRGHLFGRQDSTSSLPRKSQEVTAPRSGNSRLSISGSTTLAKPRRKPPPRYDATPDIDADRSALSPTQLYQSSGSRKTFTRLVPVESGAPQGKEDKRDKYTSKDSSGTKEKRDPVLLLLRKPTSPTTTPGAGSFKSDRSILEQIGEPDHKGWLRKRGDYIAWKKRYFVLKGPHLYWLKSGNALETKIKGYLKIVDYRVVADESVDPGRYGFKLVHDTDRPHFFSSDEQMAVREWMKAFMKATIERDYSRPVVSSANVPTIPLSVAQAMNPAPRPPSPTALAAIERAMRRENRNQLSMRDAEILMSLLPSNGHDGGGNRLRIDSIFSEPPTEAPSTSEHPPIEWANSHLPRRSGPRDP